VRVVGEIPAKLPTFRIPAFDDERIRDLSTGGLGDRIGEPIFRAEKVRLTSTILAIRHAYRLIDDPCATCPRRSRGADEPSLYYVI
jgi:hypothetical protein